MKKHILLILLALAGITAQAQIPAGYYNSADGKTGTELRQALHDIIKGHTTISYNNIWNAFWSTDNKGNGVVWDMYSDIPNGTPPYTYQMGQNQCGEYNSEGDCYNREHSFPQSWFGDQDCPAKTDLHHIFPTDGYVNSQRGNLPYGEVGSSFTPFLNGSKLGTCKSSLNYNGTVFEPIDEYKGDFARAIMYMSVRYYTEDSSWGTSGMTDKSNIEPWAVTMLLRWNEEDPVSQKEIDRNNVIYNDYQHNRNPFIDNPEYARMIWDPNWTPSTPSGGDFVKVTSTDQLEDGDYLIVCESNNVAFNGALTTLDAVGNTITINSTNNTIAQSNATNAATFTITAKAGGGYSIKSASGLFIGNDDDANTLKSSSTDDFINSISFTNGEADIVSSSSHLRYNQADGQTRFRYYKSGTYTNQQAIQFYKKTEAFTAHYYLVTSTDQLVVGRKYLIVNTTAGKAMSTTQNGNNRGAVEVSINNGVIETIGNSVCELQLGKENNHWTFFDPTNHGYLYAASNDNNYLRTQATNNANGEWAISIASNNAATITAQGTNSHNIIRYNSTNNPPIFSCYASGQQDVCLFVRSETCDFTESGSVCLNAFDKNIIHSGVTLTASSVCGINQYTDPSLLIIEEGAQLIHQAGGLKATLKKTIQAYTEGESDGWYTIAVPFSADFNPNQIATADYDLYYYDEDALAEWINYKAHPEAFPQPLSSGYLYAHKPSTTLRMTGTLNSGNYSPTVNLSYGNNNESIKGYNLLGNPTAHEISFTKSANVSDGYYYLNNNETWTYKQGNTVPVGRGFLVKANAANQSVTLNPQGKDNRDDLGRFLVINIDGDLAYVKLTNGVSMPLLSFKGRHSKVWLNREGKPYIMLVRDQAEAIDLCYQPNNEHHTLSVEAKGLDLGYLHLIDHLTGADIDLLQNPNYRFESSSSDYEARFQLVFSPNAVTDHEVFAYYADGKIIVYGVSEPYQLEIIDITGRIVNTVSPGVYVLRLTTPEKVRIQKIVIN